MDKNLLGIDIGGTKTAVVIGNENLKIIIRTEFSTSPELGFKDFLKRLLYNISKTKKTHNFKAMGISVGGPLNVKRGILHNPPHLGWGTVHLLDEMRKRFKCPIKVEHDAKAGAIAEFELGAGKGLKNIVFLTLGTGLGAGIIINGQIYRGSNNTAGEIGHIRISDHGPSVYGKVGSWESYCSGEGIAKLANHMFPDQFDKKITTQEISKLANSGDEKATKVLRESGKYLGIGMANLFDILDPDRIILGSLSLRLPSVWLEEAKRMVKREALDGENAVKKIVKSQLGEQIGDYSALITAQKAIKEDKDGTRGDR